MNPFKKLFKYPGLELEKRLGYVFNDRTLLQKAITHKSQTIENIQSYERLEFLGDSVLQLVITEYLFRKFPQDDEGKLSLYRASIVNKKSLSSICNKIGLIKFIRVNESVDLNNESTLINIASSVLESIIGAIYIDGGLKPARKFIYKNIIDKVDIDETLNSFNYKGRLIEFCYQHGLKKPKFKTLSRGPDHDKTFACKIIINNNEIGTGTGKSKKKAEENASKDALERLVDKST